MKTIVVGSGTLGTAVQQTLAQHGHEVVTVGRTSGMLHADITDMASLTALFSTLEPFDAVANAAGDVFPASLEQTTDEQWAKSIAAKGMGQINLVRAALPYIAGKDPSPWYKACSATKSPPHQHWEQPSTRWWKDSSKPRPPSCPAASASTASARPY
jgi:NAD(P)-dependent dehydrogenase (short-subunit alcohol dehydrogenase family)